MYYQLNLKRILFLYAIQFCTYVRSSINVQMIAPDYVKYQQTATLYCNHSVLEANIRKIDFIKDNRKILEYIKDRKTPFIEYSFNGARLQYSPDGKVIQLKNLTFESSGKYWCDVSTVTPIFTKESNRVLVKVIAPQKEDPWITFKKSSYIIGEYLEANCSSAAANPVPNLSWIINGHEVESPLVTHYQQVKHKDNLMSAITTLKIQLIEAHIRHHGHLEISCQATIPSYPLYRGEYADYRNKTVQVQIVSAQVITSLAARFVTSQMIFFSLICGTVSL